MHLCEDVPSNRAYSSQDFVENFSSKRQKKMNNFGEKNQNYGYENFNQDFGNFQNQFYPQEDVSQGYYEEPRIHQQQRFMLPQESQAMTSRDQQESMVQARHQQFLESQRKINKEFDYKLATIPNDFSNKYEFPAGHVNKLHVEVARPSEPLKKQAEAQVKTFCNVFSADESKAVPNPKPLQEAVKFSIAPGPEPYPRESKRTDKEELKTKPLEKIDKIGKFLVPCSINGIKFKDSLCDGGADVNIISKGIAKKLGINELKPCKCPMSFRDASSTISHGFVSNLVVQLGDYDIRTSFHVLEMKDDPHKPLILGSPFLELVGALVDSTNHQISFSNLNKGVFYPALQGKSSFCMTISTNNNFQIDPGDAIKEVQDVENPAPPTIHKDVVKPTIPKGEKTPSVAKSILAPKELKYELVHAQQKLKMSSKLFSTFRIIIPTDLKEKGEEFIQEKVNNTIKLFPEAMVLHEGHQDANRWKLKPSSPECREAKGVPIPLVESSYA